MNGAMNLLGHYVCSSPLPPAGRLGSLLPDLWSLFRRKPRADALAGIWRGRAGLSTPYAEIVEGMDFHHLVDIHYHRAPLFREEARELRERLQLAGGEAGLKRFFAAHIIIEMFHDRLLLAADPGLTDQFHRLLRKEGESLLPGFTGAHPEVDRQVFEDFFRRIMEERFVEDYSRIEGLFFRAGRVLLRQRQRELNQAERAAAVQFIEEKTAKAKTELARFVVEMQTLAEGPHQVEARAG